MKKLLLTLGTVAAVAAPVASVVACSSDETTVYDGINATISKALADNSDTNLVGGPIPAAAKGEYPTLTTEGDLKRTIKIVNTGYIVEFDAKQAGENGATSTFHYYSKDDNKAALDALAAKLTAEEKTDGRAFTFKDGAAVKITSMKVLISDITADGAVAVVEPTDSKIVNMMADPLKTIVLKAIDDALKLTK